MSLKKAKVLTVSQYIQPFTDGTEMAKVARNLPQGMLDRGNEIRVRTERKELSLALSEMNRDSWVVFELPGFATAASGTQQNSLDALRKASETSYFKDKDSLWVKLFVPADPEPPVRPTIMQASINVSR